MPKAGQVVTWNMRAGPTGVRQREGNGGAARLAAGVATSTRARDGRGCTDRLRQRRRVVSGRHIPVPVLSEVSAAFSIMAE